jgi:hypothetical protein
MAPDRPRVFAILLKASAEDEQRYLKIAESVEGFLGRLRTTADTLGVQEREKALRLLVKEILVDHDTITIKRSMPGTAGGKPAAAHGCRPKACYPPAYLRAAARTCAVFSGTAYQTSKCPAQSALSGHAEMITTPRFVAPAGVVLPKVEMSYIGGW